MNELDDVVFFSPGSVLRRSISVLSLEIPVFLTITTLTFSPFIALTVLAGLSDSAMASNQSFFSNYIVSLICQPLAAATLIHGVFRRLRGERASLTECLQTGLSRIFPVVGFSLLSSLLTTLGASMCLIPGMIMSCMLYVGLPSVVVEGKGPIEAARRSDNLTKGFRWQIFSLIVIVWLISILMSSALIATMTALDIFSNASLVSQLISYLIQIVTTALSAVLTAVAYHDLRVSRDGIDSNDLVSVFD